MKKLFGTDGIRGKANTEPMTVETALRLGRAAASYFKKRRGRHRILIGKDTRLSGYMIENALVSGICSMGVDILLVGPFPTPGVAFMTKGLRADAGIVISASHNPFEDNGIKFFSPTGHKLPDKVEMKIEKIFFSSELDSIRPTARDVGKAYRIDDASGRYIEFLKNTFPGELTLEGLKLTIDCANGAAYKIAPAVFEELGARVSVISNKPSGTNINKACGAMYPEIMMRHTVHSGSHVGITLDGDADRVMMCDEKGNLLDGDDIMALCLKDVFAEADTKILVATVMSNMGLDRYVQKHGGTVIRTAVGDRYVHEEMEKTGALLGGETSGHIIFARHTTTGDGILTALQVLKAMQRAKRPLSTLSGKFTKFPQIHKTVDVTTKTPFEKVPGLKERMEQCRAALGRDGRLIMRYSGTQNVLRITIEGKDYAHIAKYAEALEQTALEELT